MNILQFPKPSSIEITGGIVLSSTITGEAGTVAADTGGFEFHVVLENEGGRINMWSGPDHAEAVKQANLLAADFGVEVRDLTTLTEAAVKKPFEAQKTWRENNPQKVWAQRALRSAMKMGMIEAQPCRVCGSEPAEAHHPDYDKPMVVRWLCRTHHKAEHARLKAEEV